MWHPPGGASSGPVGLCWRSPFSTRAPDPWAFCAAGLQGPQVQLATVPGARQLTGCGVLAGRRRERGRWLVGRLVAPPSVGSRHRRVCAAPSTLYQEPPWKSWLSPGDRPRVSASLSALQEAFLLTALPTTSTGPGSSGSLSTCAALNLPITHWWWRQPFAHLSSPPDGGPARAQTVSGFSPLDLSLLTPSSKLVCATYSRKTFTE